MHTESQGSSDCSIGSHVSCPAMDEPEKYQTCSLDIICQSSSVIHQEDGQRGASENGCLTEAIEMEGNLHTQVVLENLFVLMVCLPQVTEKYVGKIFMNFLRCGLNSKQSSLPPRSILY